MTENLNQKTCRPCEKGAAPLAGSDLEHLTCQLPDAWQVIDGYHLKKEFRFDDFRQALDFTNRVGEIAEEEGHHPTLCLTWGRVEISIWTHKVNGLTENDFILAAKAEQLLKGVVPTL